MGAIDPQGEASLDPRMLVLIWTLNVGILIVFLKEFFEKNNFDKKSVDGIKNHPSCKRLRLPPM